MVIHYILSIQSQYMRERERERETFNIQYTKLSQMHIKTQLIIYYISFEISIEIQNTYFIKKKFKSIKFQTLTIHNGLSYSIHSIQQFFTAPYSSIQYPKIITFEKCIISIALYAYHTKNDT